MNYSVLSNKKTRIDPRSGETIKDLLTLTYIDPSEYNYIIFEVPTEYIARPDLISIDQYGSDEYTDIICKLNGISNPYELNEGMLLALPNAGLLSLFRYDGDTIEQDAASTNNTQNPQAKKVNEKRGVNEAIIGDKRYKIDIENRAVIY